MLDRFTNVYTAADLTELIQCLHQLDFESADIDLILADQQKLIALRRLLSDIPNAINPEQEPELFKALILVFARNFELLQKMRERNLMGNTV